MPHIIDGIKSAATLRQQISTDLVQIVAQYHRPPRLDVILVGDDPASGIYVKNKIKYAQQVGIISHAHCLSANTPQIELLELIEKLNNDATVDGILLQLPIPQHIDSALVLDTIDPKKDIDGLHPHNIGRLIQGKPAPISCTPQGCIKLLTEELGDLTGLHAVVIGRSNMVGKPMAILLLQHNCTVSIIHSHSNNSKNLSRQADIIVAAAGVPQMVTADWVKPGAVIIDVGINPSVDSSGVRTLVGDVDFAHVMPITRAITPVPGGVGPMTIACLLYNTLQAYKKNMQ